LHKDYQPPSTLKAFGIKPSRASYSKMKVIAWICAAAVLAPMANGFGVTDCDDGFYHKYVSLPPHRVRLVMLKFFFGA
jgi:hypothetical protein